MFLPQTTFGKTSLRKITVVFCFLRIGFLGLVINFGCKIKKSKTISVVIQKLISNPVKRDFLAVPYKQLKVVEYFREKAKKIHLHDSAWV